MSKNILMKIISSIILLLLGGAGGSILSLHYINESINVKCNNEGVDIKNENSASPTIHIENNPVITPKINIDQKSNNNRIEEQPVSQATIKKTSKEVNARNEIKLLKQEYRALLQSNIDKTDCEKQRTRHYENSILNEIEATAQANNIYAEYKNYLAGERGKIMTITLGCDDNKPKIVF